MKLNFPLESFIEKASTTYARTLSENISEALLNEIHSEEFFKENCKYMCEKMNEKFLKSGRQCYVSITNEGSLCEINNRRCVDCIFMYETFKEYIKSALLIGEEHLDSIYSGLNLIYTYAIDDVFFEALKTLQKEINVLSDMTTPLDSTRARNLEFIDRALSFANEHGMYAMRRGFWPSIKNPEIETVIGYIMDYFSER